MVSVIRHKRSTVASEVPVIADLVGGELAINVADGKLFLRQINGGLDQVLEVASKNYAVDRTALLAINTTQHIRAFFDGDIWNYKSTSFANILRTLVGTSTAVDATANTITINNHGLETGIALVSGTIANGLTIETLYYAIVVDANNIKVATTYANAQAGTAIDLTGTTNVTIWRHNDPAQGVIVTKTGNITGTLGGWERDNYTARDWDWRWFGVVGDIITSGPDRSQAINAWMAAANAFKPRMTHASPGLHALDYVIHQPTHTIGLHGFVTGTGYSSLYKRYTVANGPNIVSSAVDSSTDTITANAHGLATGTEVFTSTAVNGLLANTLYYVIAVDANNYKLATKRSLAVAGTAVDLTATNQVTIKTPSKRGLIALKDHGCNIQHMLFQGKADGTISGGAGFSAIISQDALRLGDLIFENNHISMGVGANFGFVLDGSANISTDLVGGIGSNGQRDCRIKNNLMFAGILGTAHLYSPFGLDWDNSLKGNVGGGGNAPVLILTGQATNRATLVSMKNDVPWGDVSLDYLKDGTFYGRKGGNLSNTVEVENISWIGENSAGTTEQNWIGNSGFGMDRRPSQMVVGPKTTGSSELATGHILLSAGSWSSKVAGTGTNNHAVFYNDSLVSPTFIGGITSNGSAVTYATSSDSSLKEDRGEMSVDLAMQILRLMKFHEFDWLVNGQRDYGVFAQELHEIYPFAVVEGEGWVLEEDGSAMYKPWQVDYSKLVVPLGRAMQVMLDKQDALEARLTALEQRL